MGFSTTTCEYTAGHSDLKKSLVSLGDRILVKMKNFILKEQFYTNRLMLKEKLKNLMRIILIRHCLD